MSVHHLQIKNLTLAQELRLIRRKEINARKWKRLNNPDWNKTDKTPDVRQYKYVLRKWNYNEKLRVDLWGHRTRKVRPESRALHLAVGYLYKVPYRTMEKLAYEPPAWDKVWKNLITVGALEDTQDNRDKFIEWADLMPDDLRNTNERKDYVFRLSEPKPSILIKANAFKGLPSDHNVTVKTGEPTG